LGIQGLKFLAADSLEYWFKPLENDEWAFCILNRAKETVKDYTIDWQKFNLHDDVSDKSTAFDSKVYNIRNLWTKKEEGNTAALKKGTIPAQDVVMYRLTVKPPTKKK
jgi:alpha-galactosidase